MTDPRQPKYVPVFAGDQTTSSTYTDPGKPWDGEHTLDQPSAGNVAAGIKPKGSWLGAQQLNFLLQNYSEHIEALADIPVFDTRHPLADRPSDVLDYCTTAGDTYPNVNGPSDYPLLFATDKFVLSQCGHKSGNVGSGFVRRWRQSSHTENSFDADQAAVLSTTTTNNPFTGGTTAGDTAAGDGNNPAVLGVDETSGTIISLGSSRTVKVSTDYGVTWGSGTALPTNANWHWPLCACQFAGQWVVIDQIDTTTKVNRLVASTDLTATTWNVLSGSLGGANSGYVRRMTHNSSTVVFLPDQDTLIGYWHATDPGISTIRIASADSSRTGWRGAWNEQVGLFLIGNGQGDLWTSADGQAWTQIANNAAGLCVRDIVAHGRGFVISNSGVTWAIDYLDFDRNGTYRLRHLYQAVNQAVNSAFHLARHGGRWYGGRVTLVVAGGPTDSYRMEWVYSGVDQWDKNNAVGR